MKITEVRVSLREDAKLKAFASITLDDSFVIRGLKIIEGKTGTFVAMPSRRRKDGEYQDIAHPINNDARAEMERIILDEYRKERERAKVTETSEFSDRR
jgi:stage V sporulation protein G